MGRDTGGPAAAVPGGRGRRETGLFLCPDYHSEPDPAGDPVWADRECRDAPGVQAQGYRDTSPPAGTGDREGAGMLQGDAADRKERGDTVLRAGRLRRAIEDRVHRQV